MPLLSHAGTMTIATLFPTCLVSVILGTTNNRWHCCANLKTSGGVVLGWVEEEDG